LVLSLTNDEAVADALLLYAMLDRYTTLPFMLVVYAGAVAALLLETIVFLLGFVLAYARPRPPVVVEVSTV